MTHPTCDCRRCAQQGRGRDPCRADAPPCDCRPPHRPHRPPRPCAETVLLQKIVCSERRSYPALCAELAPDAPLACGEAPFRLVMVQQSGAQPWWTPLERGADGRLCLRVHIPVCCQARDACGRLFAFGSVVEVDASLRPGCPLAECWRHSLYIAACVRLCEPACSADGRSFSARLEVVIDLYLLRPEPYAIRRPEPACPELPLYPQPIHPPLCSARCPEAPAPCEWPRQG